MILVLAIALLLSQFDGYCSLRIKIRPFTAREDHLSVSPFQFLTPQTIPTLKLPVWPVWSGVIAQIVEWLRLPSSFSNTLLDAIGGRVIPMPLTDYDLSPFLLLVHHAHSFHRLDPIRPISRWFLPEGFPAHPHAGFDTVTICLEGGLRHRDSEGVGMVYGDGEVQWMRAGRGVIHEEMWQIPERTVTKKSHEIDREYFKWFQRNELFQLWINLPQSKKDSPASVRVLKAEDMPTIK